MANFYRFRRALRLASAGIVGFFSLTSALAQVPAALPSAADTVRAMPEVALDDVVVAPAAVDTKEWLLLNADIQTELDGAVHNLYNFKFDQAERQFRSLRRRYPQHPMPYFLLGLSTWWKIMPSNTYNQQYDKTFFAYMDTATTKAQKLYDADNNNYEASFFLSAAYGFDARLHAERHDWRKATVSSKRALTYLQKSREANGLSPEFVFGEGLFNYYAVWIAEEYRWLRPVLWFFPKGNRTTGLAQLDDVAQHGFYTAAEARFFRMRILGSPRENNTAGALAVARDLTRDFPDNSCFQRARAQNAFAEGELTECERTSRDILAKVNKGLPGYEGFSGRAAAYYLGYVEQHRYHNFAAAQDFYQRCMVFSESVGQTKGGYYLFAAAGLGRLAAQASNRPLAQRYFQVVLQQAERKSDLYQEANRYLKKNAMARNPAATEAMASN
ncbi:tol-pal system protein YbgF [Hymenobacter monticola]|uniref:Tol-pal system protein YbgF n=1 Tax=Hymenobacter monticola TaxID=1705399 RepID=A0ABY4B6H1_9BACT|nr:tol-pal system protein YbgF [Hymenobacter monticola]UOE34635.1 tol-pal system protein YbgF [Hymenobacter monticola]